MMVRSWEAEMTFTLVVGEEFDEGETLGDVRKWLMSENGMRYLQGELKHKIPTPMRFKGDNYIQVALEEIYEKESTVLASDTDPRV